MSLHFSVNSLKESRFSGGAGFPENMTVDQPSWERLM